MDTDVEVVKPLDEFLVHQAFTGFEDMEHIPTGIMACEKGNELFLLWLREYDEMRFIEDDGSYNMQTNVVMLSGKMRERGLKLDNTFQVADGCAFYPNDYFCPKDHATNRIMRTRRTHTIHHFAASWFDEETRKRYKKVIREVRRADTLHFIAHIPHRIGRTLLGNERYEQMKQKLGRK